MTSNVGADILSKTRGNISQDMKDAVMKKFLERGLPLEFINRIDEVVMFVGVEFIQLMAHS
jgi:ATP-dependent Clp protease ATP-binding subunit ClpB